MATASRTDNDGFGAGAGRTARRGMWGLARIVSLVTALVVALIVVGILLVVLEANKSNDIVKALLDAARFLAGPLDDVFKVGGHKVTVAVNWGLAALVYALVGGLIARLLRR
jgi:membrane-bound ClpP family serine protease